MLLVTVHNQIGYSRTEDTLAPLQGLYRRHKVRSFIGFEDPPAHARFQAFPYYLLGVHSGKDKYRLGWVEFQNLPCCVHTIQFWQANIQNDQIRLRLFALFNRLASVRSFSTYFPTFVRSKQRGQPEPEYWMIVNYQNTK